jgi:ABC-type enterochelin transport system substrate-binding protein
MKDLKKIAEDFLLAMDDSQAAEALAERDEKIALLNSEQEELKQLVVEMQKQLDAQQKKTAPRNRKAKEADDAEEKEAA